MNRQTKYIMATTLLWVYMLVSCSAPETETPYTGADQLKVTARVSARTEQTRVVTDPDDHWTVAGFSSGDVAGLFMSHGNLDVDNGAGAFNNVRMIYNGPNSNNGAVFVSDGLSVDRAQMDGNEAVLYYPYSADIESGVPLRDAQGRCTDYMVVRRLTGAAQGSAFNMNGTFEHNFSEVVITRGDGFREVPEAYKDEITIVLNESYSHVKMIDNPNTSTYQGGYKVLQNYLANDENEAECKKWKAWRGADYGGQHAWYAVLPTSFITNPANDIKRPAIASVMIYDDNGVEQLVSDIALNDSNQKDPNGSTLTPVLPTLVSGMRYVIEIKSDGIEIKIFPHEILKWGEEVDITDKREAGISTAEDFMSWLGYYNEYTTDRNNTTVEENLMKFGNKIVEESTGKTSWEFFILNDIEFNDDYQVRITKLEDVLDGLGNTLSNIRIDQSMIGTIADGGTLKSLVIEGLTVNRTSVTEATGGVANLITGGSVENCDIDATVVGSRDVGILAASMTGGSVKDCNFSGLLVGAGSDTGTYQYLFASAPTGVTITGSNYSNIYFQHR